MKVGDLCWVFEGCHKTYETPVVYLGNDELFVDAGHGHWLYHIVLMQEDGMKQKLAAYYYNLVPVKQ